MQDEQPSILVRRENILTQEEPNCDSKHVLRHLSSSPWRNTDMREQPQASANCLDLLPMSTTDVHRQDCKLKPLKGLGLIASDNISR